MMMMVTNAGKAFRISLQSTLLTESIMSAPTTTSAPPVAHGGMLAKIGLKNNDRKNNSPTTTAVRPILPPALIPAPLSMYAVVSVVPINDPIMVPMASDEKAQLDLGKSPL